MLGIIENIFRSKDMKLAINFILDSENLTCRLFLIRFCSVGYSYSIGRQGYFITPKLPPCRGCFNLPCSMLPAFGGTPILFFVMFLAS